MRHFQIPTMRVLLLVCTLLFMAPILAQTKAPANHSNSSATKSTANGDKSGKPDPPALAGNIAKAVNDGIDDHSDYVPCFFSKKQLLELQPKPESATLSRADAEALRASVIAAALAPENASGFTSGPPQEFAVEVGKSVFEGLTPSQALTRVLDLLSHYTVPKVDKTITLALRGLPSSAFAEAYALPGKQGDVTNEINNREDLDKIISNLNPPGQQVMKDATDQSQNQSQTAKNNLANAARSNLALSQRPNDIGCSMSILSYETTRKAFGETMADEYIGVQIVVRNVNADQEFLVQSAEFKVDDDINGRIGRYFSGVDKLTAREYMLASRDFGKRNLMVHVVQGTGAIMSAMVPLTGPFVKQFSGVYSGAFAGALTTVFPDHNTEQLKLIDDEGFSNSRTDRTVVPKSGTAEFVIFISSREFEQGWWTQDCAERIAMQSSSTKRQAECIGTYNKALPDPKCLDAEIGIDINAARRVCLAEHLGDPTVQADDNNPELKYFKPKSKDYRKWSQKAVAIFRELSLAVVAGTHVRESSDSTPALTKIDCPIDDKGNVKLDSAKDGVIGCTLTGTNLDKVAQLKLRNYLDATDTKTADGTVSTSGDSKSAKASFPVEKLCELTASAYKVYTVTKDGVEGGGDQLLHFDSTTPLLFAGPDPAIVDIDKLQAKDAKPAQIALKGCHLDKVTGVELTGGTQSIDLKMVEGTLTTSAASFSVGLDDIKSKITPNHSYTADSPLTFSISLQTSASPTSTKIVEKLSFIGELKSNTPTKTTKQPTAGKKLKQPVKPTPEGNAVNH
jgi:hypothetical protein